MKRKITILALTIILALSVFALSSCFLIPDEIQFELNEDGESYYVSNIRSGVKVADIPAEYEGKPVTAIGEDAGEEAHSSLKELIIPEGVTSIGKGAFKGCSNLEKIVIPITLASTGEIAFYFEYYSKKPSSSLEIHLADPESYIKGEHASVPKGKFYSNGELITSLEIDSSSKSLFGNSQITDIVIKSDLSKIPDEMFSLFTSLKGVVIEEGVKEIGHRSFYGCSALEEVILPNGLEIIGGGAFEKCSMLKKITIPQSLERIGAGAFYYAGEGAYEQTGKDLQVHISSIEHWCGISFEGDQYLYDLYLNGSVVTTLDLSGVEKISRHAFEGCYSITNVIIGDKITEIGYNSFYNCNALESVIIGANVTYISHGAFSSCEALESVTFKSTSGKWHYMYGESKTGNLFELGTPEENAELFKGSSLAYHNIKKYKD